MAKLIFVNLPVRDLTRSTDFFAQLGFTVNPQYSDEKATCLSFSDTIYCMLLTEPFFKTFTGKALADATATTEVIVALSVDSREAVDVLVDQALATGGQVSNEPMDHGFMYVRSFQDPDGHLWEIMWMDPVGAPQQPVTVTDME